jgi:hypothetical protein
VTQYIELPANIRMISYTIEQFKTDAKKALGFEIALDYANKYIQLSQVNFKPPLQGY